MRRHDIVRAAPLMLMAGILLVAAMLAPGAPAAPAPATPNQQQGLLLTPPGGEFQPGNGLRELRLEQLLGALAGREPIARKQVIDQLLAASREDAPHLDQLLHRQTPIPAADYKNVLQAVGALVPDSNGRFPREDLGEDAVDWLAALLKLERRQLQQGLAPALPEAILSVALIRALAHTGHPDAGISLLRFAYRHRGAFRDECGRWLRKMGPYAVPGLLRARTLDDPLAYKMARYADYQLDRMNCARPDLALQKTERGYRGELLHAYGEVRDPAAVSAVLQYTNDSSARLRREARWATLRYLSGRPPKAAKRKLKLSGGRQSAQEQALYLTYQELAVHALAGRLAEELSSSPAAPTAASLQRELEPRALAERLFALYDQRRAEAQRAKFDQALKLSQAGSLQQAVARFDRLLAADPYHPRRQEMAPFFRRLGQELLSAGDYPQAALVLAKAVFLHPHDESSARTRALRLCAEALAVDAPAAERQWRLQQALALSPDLELPRRLLHQLEQEKAQGGYLLTAAAGVGALSLLFALALFRRRVLRWPAR